jgi:predicted glycoside hydrolase/deacetylase ChbG (UPF0249 family)
MRRLVVNADDFGLTEGVNRGVIQAHEEGIVTSASLMVRHPAAASAAAYGKQRPSLSLGLHADLGEWIYEGGRWTALYELERVESEIERQLDAFRSLVGSEPSHVDSHQHVHREEPLRSIMLTVAGRLGVPLRGCNPVIGYCGSFYGQTGPGEPLEAAISVEALLTLLHELPEGITELGCHPGYSEGLSSQYRAERERELETLCHPRVRTALADERIDLCSFRDLRGSTVCTAMPVTLPQSSRSTPYA